MTLAHEIGRHITDAETRRQANVLPHVCRYLMEAKGDLFRACRNAERANAWPQVQTFLKAAVTAGSTQSGNWAQPLAEFDSVVSGFIESLRSFSAFDAAVEWMQRVPIRTRIALFSTGPTSGTTAEGTAKVVSRLTLSGVSISETKCGCVVVVSDELLKHAAASTQLLGNELRRSLGVQTDNAFLSKLSTGITPSVASGNNATAILTDVEVALEAMTFSSNAKIFAVTQPVTAKAIRTKATTAGELAFPGPLSGGAFGLTTLIASDGVPSGQMILFDATQLAGDPGVVEIDASNQATIELSDTPASPPVASTPFVSLFQNDLSALRAERIFAIERPRAASVAIIGSIAY